MVDFVDDLGLMIACAGVALVTVADDSDQSVLPVRDPYGFFKDSACRLGDCLTPSGLLAGEDF